jgi:hypothetical protein
MTRKINISAAISCNSFILFRQNLTAKDTVRKQNETLDEEIPTQYCSNHPERKAEFTVEIE